MNPDRPVVVIGAGPTGLTLANLLAAYNVPVLLVERNTSTVQEPRAVSIDDEALRTIQAMGIVDRVLPELLLGYGSHYYSSSGKCFLQVKPQTLEYGYPRRNAFRQPTLEAILRDHLLSHSNVEVWFGSELIGFEQDADHVTLLIRRPDGSQSEVRSTYLIGCDGGRSLTRQKLDIALVGSTFRERWLIIDLDKTNDASRDTKVFCNPDRPCISLPGPGGTRRFEFKLHSEESDETALAPDNIASLIARYSNDHTCEIRRKAIYTFHARIAERWRDGRVFLAGDAAHLSPPFAGQGMNSGIRDAHNLAWKLAMVLQGRLGPNLLDTYESERRDHAHDMIRLAIRMGHVMMPRSRAGALALQTAFTILNLFGPARDYFAEMKYKPKPHFRRGFFVKQHSPDESGNLVGKLFPQPICNAGSPSQLLLDEALGNSFALLASPGASPRMFDQLSENLCKALQPKRIAMSVSGTDQDGKVDGVTRVNVSHDFAAQFLSDSPGLFLLRPDRYVAAYLPQNHALAAFEELNRLISSTWTS